ncbi:aif1p [Saccharomyces arboricola H-6]|uniref:Aif1p n=1 Tax=Saccharomyces arboricola (strain H-6 / AS 2.3317 / CBS 10644) TaxID=1160507 RepID=J8PIB2_SACAR|nr:aif1p [Saccharomyces arboricola H-6]
MTVDTKNIVIVGAGVFGVSVANHLYRELGGTYAIKLVTVSDYVYFLPSAVRLTVSKDYTKSISPLKSVLDDGVEVIKDTAVSFDVKRVVLGSGRTIEFDILILATGSKWSDPIGSTYTFGDNYEEYFEREASRISDANHILFLGGGFVNCELAGELLFKYSDEIRSGKKHISIIHNSDKLLPDSGLYNDTLRKNVTGHLSNNGITLHLNTVGAPSDTLPKRIFLGEGSSKYIDADLIYRGVGISPNVPANGILNLCDKKGFIQVEKNFKVKAVEAENVFAIGDVTNFRYHGLVKRDNWVDVLTRNVISYTQEGTDATLVDADCLESGHAPTGVSLGPNAGFGQFPLPLLGTINIPSFLISRVKSKNLFSNEMESMYKK